MVAGTDQDFRVQILDRERLCLMLCPKGRILKCSNINMYTYICMYEYMYIPIELVR